MTRSFLLILCCAPILSAQMGPSLPPIKGAKKASTAPFWEAYGIQAVLRDLPGAVVVVEDSMPDILPHAMPRLSLFYMRVNFKGGEMKADPHVVYLMPDWLNPANISSGGTVVQRSCNLGGANF